jgi:hypothetical protein
MIIKQNTDHRYSDSNIETMEKLPVGNYLLKFDMAKNEFYLESRNQFTLPSKIYGDGGEMVERYLNTFKKKNGNLGVLLQGTKGTGKSLTARQLCIEANLPVILIDSDFGGIDFRPFITNLDQEMVVFIDEFEKVFEGKGNQDSFLSLLDGTATSSILFLFTVNKTRGLSQYLKNRPGRIHYIKEYTTISKEVLEEVMEDLLENKEHKKEIREIYAILTNMSMDILISLIWECNEYGENPRKAIQHLNITPENNYYDQTITYKGTKMYAGQWNGHPLIEKGIYLEFDVKEAQHVKELGTDWFSDSILLEDCEKSIEDETIIVKHPSGIEVTFKPFVKSKYAF